MRLIVGLGNPGDQYKETRHNVGFMAVDRLSTYFGENQQWESVKKPPVVFIKLPRLILAKPQTYMNRAGEAVSSLMRMYKVKPDNVWVVYDDLDIPFGSIKIKTGGGSAGHHGIDSIIEKIGTDDFVRFRIGIGEIGEEVLKPFSSEEMVILSNVLKEASEAIIYAKDAGVGKAMNKFNKTHEQKN